MYFSAYRTSLPVAASGNIIQNPLCSEYASVDIQNINHYRSLQPPNAAPAAMNAPSSSNASAAPASYNLGHYFPRVNSEPPTRKNYQTTVRNITDPLKVNTYIGPYIALCSRKYQNVKLRIDVVRNVIFGNFLNSEL